MIDKRALKTARGRFAVVVIALAIALGVYRMLRASDLNSSALLFIGIPAILALIVALSPPAKTTVGMVFRTITIALLLTGILFIEGTICIILAAPIFYLVGLLVALVIDWARREWNRRKNVALFLAPLLFLSMEGVTPTISFDREESVTAFRVLEGSAEQVRFALEQRPRFDKELPPFLRMGFPRPDQTSGEGLAVGDRRLITFPMKKGTGVLQFAVAESEPQRVRFAVVRDTTVYRQWLEMKEAVVEWRAVGIGRTQVSWTLRFDRRLDPIWYFSPLERYGTRLAAGYLIDTLATPPRE